jgi:hypothetical protein
MSLFESETMNVVRAVLPIPKATHIFAKEIDSHYVEPQSCSIRLFDVERFPEPLWDPFAGWGRIVEAGRNAGYRVRATDIVDRGFRLDEVLDFLTVESLDPGTSIVANPPFDNEILKHIVALDPVKAALIWPFARMVAAWHILAPAPLAHVWMMTPRPSMPPGSYLAAGNRPGGARVEHCWLVFERGHCEPPTLGWLRLNGGQES